MSHYGFGVPGEVNVAEERDCVVWLFNEVRGSGVVPLVLDTPVKYAFASLGTFALAVMVELVVRWRRTGLPMERHLARCRQISTVSTD